MSISEARKYIKDLHKRQDDTFLWPDFLTGLPDKHSVVAMEEIMYPKLGTDAISYVRIININTYLVKYGTEKHAEIIQWAAAILKTVADKKKAFVGAFSNHDFIVISKTKDMEPILEEARKLFVKKVRTFYSKKDIDKNVVLSFKRAGKKVDLGFMDLIYSTMGVKTDIPRQHLIPFLAKSCASQEEF